jgi:cytochrome P450
VTTGAVDDLELPAYPNDPAVRGDRFHRHLADLVRQSWLARNELGYVVLEREAVIDFLRDRRLAFPAVELLELQGVTEGPVHERTEKGLMRRVGEDHRRLRRIVSPAFTPKASDALRPRLQAFLDELYAPLAEDGRCEFVGDVATPLPSMAIAELLGLPGEAERLARWSFDLQAVFALDPSTREQTESAYLEVYAYLGELVEERRRSPGDDLVSTLVQLSDEGDRLSDDEVLTLITSVIAGGTDTTAAQLGHGMRLFVEHPEQWELLGERPELAPAAVQEMLRFEPITPFTARLVQEDLEYRGVRFPAGTVVFACTATANRDPAAFADPDRFDITVDRGSTQILTFGYGAHFCLGVNLARAELIEAFARLAPRMRDPRLAGEAVYGPTAGIYAMESLPLEFTAA